ncbi:MAG: DUF6503 family protein [Saprospiraceae bacterium]
MKTLVFLLAALALMMACKSAQTSDDSVAVEQVVAQTPAKVFSAEATAVLAKALNAHGGDRYEKAHYQFVFRGKKYTFKNEGSEFRYEVVREKNGVTTVDLMDKGVLTRTVDGKKLDLTEKEYNGISESLNSVIYFATLPHKLTDASVNLAHGGRVSINDGSYEILQVTFDQEGGGVDHDDQYRYWVNSETGRIDYLAYNYQTGKGGVRFRAAYNPRIVEGILFQDYVNYKAPVGTPLDSLPLFFEQGDLEKLSVIDTENVIAL